MKSPGLFACMFGVTVLAILLAIDYPKKAKPMATPVQMTDLEKLLSLQMEIKLLIVRFETFNRMRGQGDWYLTEIARGLNAANSQCESFASQLTDEEKSKAEAERQRGNH